MESLFSGMIILLLVSFSCFTSSEALTSNKGNITIKWDLMHWTPDGYEAVVTAYNNQKQRSIPSPGWKMSWRWAQKEVIWSMVGAKTIEQGDCSMYKANCCKGGVLKAGSASSFQITVGPAGTSNSTVRMAVNFMFTAPKQQYICGPAKNVMRTKFITADGRRTTSALMTWRITCAFHKAT
ncbi:COBRA-like protein 5 isoform X3 [Raphanus sativus]|uniref:COBRA-like protein 5 isoform X3 n=1 Tax=Raphanus sativus TaxID=3726 RepID=A0A6J0L5I1_RAPSA|nr:COBRA-like protein 5 isoform X3 [Raphanus sativus]XP_056855085.1 COBRA-like protein 5 isoform X3 [Raphanus sativus]